MDQLYAYLPGTSHRKELTPADIAPVILCYYAHAVMAILPGTFWLRVALLPVTEWLVWNSGVTLDLAQYLATMFGLPNALRLSFLNFMFALALWAVGLRCFEWTFIIDKPLRRYELPLDFEKKTRKERPLTIANVLVDGVDLLFNFRGLGWAWSSEPFYVDPNPPLSLPHQFFKLVVKIASLDAAHYIATLILPTAYRLEGDTIFDYTLDPLPHFLRVLSISVCGLILIYSSVDIMYQFCALTGQIVFGQSLTQWPRIANRPWLAMSVTEFWGKRWHQFFRHLFVVFGARPGKKVGGWYGSVIGAYIVSANMHIVMLWGLGRGTEWMHTGGFFIMLSIATIGERKWKEWTGKPVTGIFGTLWTTFWHLAWGSGMVDAFVRRGMVANDFVPKQMRIGKVIVDSILTVVARVRGG
ncbi:hypothetical protein EDB85DRAFT_2273009 [Lactarius pseudohatsudake]|nr:hypothetical protein EDB85DRAFT_2273009 [Lactarius pseudohatsudake]